MVVVDQCGVWDATAVTWGRDVRMEQPPEGARCRRLPQPLALGRELLHLQALDEALARTGYSRVDCSVVAGFSF